MANSLSSKKRIRQNEKRRVNNRVRKSRVKTQRRRLRDAIASGDTEKTQAELKQTFKLIDKVTAKKTMHKNAAARLKSRLQKRVNRVVAGQT